MEESAYAKLHEVEDVHWWFVSRRRIVRSVLQRYVTPSCQSILEIGCCSGGNLAMLRAFGTVTGVEMHGPSRLIAQSRGLDPVLNGRLPDGMPPLPAQDVITAFDVLEHIADDTAALKAMHAMLVPDGLLVLTVPAHQWLFSDYDVRLHHHRRYSRQELRQKIEASGFSLVQLSYFNFFLSPLIVLIHAMRKIRLLRMDEPEALPQPLINKLLQKIFSAEHLAIARGIGFPFGISLLAVACKR